MLDLYRSALVLSWRNRREAARFAIQFRLFEAFCFAPFAALVGQYLSGRPVVDSTELVGYALSPMGFITMFLSAMLLVTIRLVEQTGLTAIAFGGIGGHRVTSSAALCMVAPVLPRLLLVGGWILLAGLALAALPLVVAGHLIRNLLLRHDINYYLTERPEEFLKSMGVIVACSLPSLIAAVWLAVRWRLVVPVVLCERTNSWKALVSSQRIVASSWRLAALTWLVTGLLMLGLGLIAAWFGRLCSVSAVVFAGQGGSLNLSFIGGLLVFRTLLSGLVTLPGPWLSAGVFAIIYRDFRREHEPTWTPGFNASHIDAPLSRTRSTGRWILAALPFALACIALFSTVAGMGELYRDHLVTVTAHRGGTRRSIENTLNAIQEAIDDGAQFAEVDVQMSRDEVLIVTHDSDFSRQAGVAQKVWELRYDEIRKIPLIRAGSPEIAADHVPTFDELLEFARGRIRLNVELKYYGDHQPRLTERVIDAVRSKEMSDQVVVQSLKYSALEEVRRRAPEIRIGYLFSVNAREPKRLEVDFLSAQLGRVNGPFINAAHRRNQQVHVWTVDKVSDMQRLLDLGVDDLITNRPKEAVELVNEHQQLSVPQRALLRMRVWLTE